LIAQLILVAVIAASCACKRTSTATTWQVD